MLSKICSNGKKEEGPNKGPGRREERGVPPLLAARQWPSHARAGGPLLPHILGGPPQVLGDDRPDLGVGHRRRLVEASLEFGNVVGRE